MESVRDPTALDVLSVIGAFGLLTGPGIIYVIWREMGRLRRERREAQTEAEAMAAEGYPPPGPPTTDSLPDDGLE